MALNRVLLQGRLTADPELKTVGSDTSIATFRIAVDRDYKDKETGKREADFVTVNAWRSSADFVAKYFSKGDSIIIDGHLKYRSWESENGKRSALDVEADNVYFGGSKSNGAGSSDDDDLPF